ncbi:hypothetical protein RQP46_000210 [Phenoliferia psychrophenolica]
MSTAAPCAVCTAPGTLRCSRCRSIRFCGPEHQALLWSSHKVLCTPNSPLVFKSRPISDDEILSCASLGISSGMEESFGGPTEVRTLELQYKRRLASENLSERINIASYILFVNMINDLTTTKHDAWVYLSQFATVVPGLVDRPEPCPLDPETRNSFQLQMLVICTLLEKDADEKLVDLAFERLEEIVRDRYEGFLSSRTVMIGKHMASGFSARRKFKNPTR